MSGSRKLHRILSAVTVTSLIFAAFLLPSGVAAQSSRPQSLRTVTEALQAGQPIVGYDRQHDSSSPLRDLPTVGGARKGQPQHPAIPLLHLPNRNIPSHPDPVVQDTPAAPNMPSTILNFDGIPFPGVNCNCAPPDTNGEVGLSQYVQI